MRFFFRLFLFVLIIKSVDFLSVVNVESQDRVRAVGTTLRVFDKPPRRPETGLPKTLTGSRRASFTPRMTLFKPPKAFIVRQTVSDNQALNGLFAAWIGSSLLVSVSVCVSIARRALATHRRSFDVGCRGKTVDHHGALHCSLSRQYSVAMNRGTVAEKQIRLSATAYRMTQICGSDSESVLGQ